MNPRVKQLKVLDDYKLLITFTNGEKGIFDVKPYLSIGIFKSLKDRSVFFSAKVVDGTVQWFNYIDLCPDTLYIDSIKE